MSFEKIDLLEHKVGEHAKRIDKLEASNVIYLSNYRKLAADRESFRQELAMIREKISELHDGRVALLAQIALIRNMILGLPVIIGALIWLIEHIK